MDPDEIDRSTPMSRLEKDPDTPAPEYYYYQQPESSWFSSLSNTTLILIFVAFILGMIMSRALSTVVVTT